MSASLQSASTDPIGIPLSPSVMAEARLRTKVLRSAGGSSLAKGSASASFSFSIFLSGASSGLVSSWRSAQSLGWFFLTQSWSRSSHL